MAKVQHGAARQSHGSVRQIRALRRRGTSSRTWQASETYHASARLSEKPRAAHRVDRRARPGQTQTETRLRARGTETRGSGRGRVRTVEITRGGRRAEGRPIGREKLGTADARRIQEAVRDTGT